MITVDKRKGSAELNPGFPPGMSRLGHLEYADFSSTGLGPNGDPWLIGIERKQIRDLLSSITTGRLAGHQLIGLINSYNVVYLIVEGLFRPGPETGVLEIRIGKSWEELELGKQKWMMRGVWNYLNTLTTKCGVHWVKTFNKNETVQYVMSLYEWWNDKEWEEHRSHLAMQQPDTVAILAPHSFESRVANQLKGVGWKRAEEIGNSFDSVGTMCHATLEDWVAIPGIGKKLSQSIADELKGE